MNALTEFVAYRLLASIPRIVFLFMLYSNFVVLLVTFDTRGVRISIWEHSYSTRPVHTNAQPIALEVSHQTRSNGLREIKNPGITYRSTPEVLYHVQSHE